MQPIVSTTTWRTPTLSDVGDVIDADGPGDGVAELRTLLRAASPSEIDALRRRVEMLETKLAAAERRFDDEDQRAKQVAGVLSRSVELERERLGTPMALSPEVELAMYQSIREDPEVMAEALFPVLGPAIRKLIADLFTFNPKDSGAGFQISHVYLLHRETGLPLAVSARLDGDEGEADMVSGMLDALTSFVQDAFGATESDGLRDLRVGDVTVLVEGGPHAVLAVVTRGVVTSEIRPAMQQRLEEIHRTHSEALSLYQGDATPFREIEPTLGDLRALAPDPASKAASKAKPILMFILFVVVIAVIVFGVIRLSS